MSLRPFKHYWQFQLLWDEPDPQGVLREVVDPQGVCGPFDTMGEAVRIHEIACKGGWVQPGYRNPRVGPLQEYVAKPSDKSPRIRLEVNDTIRPEHPVAEVAATQPAMEVDR